MFHRRWVLGSLWVPGADYYVNIRVNDPCPAPGGAVASCNFKIVESNALQ